MIFSSLLVLSLTTTTSAFAPSTSPTLFGLSVRGGRGNYNGHHHIMNNNRFAPGSGTGPASAVAIQPFSIAAAMDGADAGTGAGMDNILTSNNSRKTELLNQIEERAAVIEARTQALREQIAAAEEEQNRLQRQAQWASSSLSRERTAANGMMTLSSGLDLDTSASAAAAAELGGPAAVVVGGVAAAAGVRTVLQNRAEKQAELRRQREEELARERARAAAAASNARFLMGPNKWPMGLVMAAVPFFAFTTEVPSDVSLQYNLDITPTTTRNTYVVPTNYVERYTFEEELVRRVAMRENEPIVSEEAQANLQAKVVEDSGISNEKSTETKETTSDLLATATALEKTEKLNIGNVAMAMETDSNLLIAKAASSTASDNTPLQFAQYAGGAVALLVAAAAVSAREEYRFEDTATETSRNTAVKSFSDPSPKRERKPSGMGGYFDLAVDVLDQMKAPLKTEHAGVQSVAKNAIGSDSKENNQPPEDDKVIAAEKEIAKKLKEEMGDLVENSLVTSGIPTISIDEGESEFSDEAQQTEFEPVLSLANDVDDVAIIANGAAPDALNIESEVAKFVSVFIGQPIMMGSALFQKPVVLLEKRKKDNETSNVRVRLTKFASSQSHRRQTGTKSALFDGRSAADKQENGSSNVKVQLTKFASLLYESLPTAYAGSK